MKPWYRRPFVLIAAAAVTLAIAFTLQVSLRPHKKKPKLPHANVAALEPGRFAIVNTDSFRYFVIRPENGDIYAVAVPMLDGVVRMPEGYWWKPYMDCKDFGLGSQNAAITAESRFRCRDANLPAEWEARWQWDIYGRHIPSGDGPKIDNMYAVHTQRDDDDIVIVGLGDN